MVACQNADAIRWSILPTSQNSAWESVVGSFSEVSPRIREDRFAPKSGHGQPSCQVRKERTLACRDTGYSAASFGAAGGDHVWCGFAHWFL